MLGEARRQLGHKKGEWTQEQNAILLSKIDSNDDGMIRAEEFLNYFHESLTQNHDDFNLVMDEFMQVTSMSPLTPTSS